MTYNSLLHLDDGYTTTEIYKYGMRISILQLPHSTHARTLITTHTDYPVPPVPNYTCNLPVDHPTYHLEPTPYNSNDNSKTTTNKKSESTKPLLI